MPLRSGPPQAQGESLPADDKHSGQPHSEGGDTSLIERLEKATGPDRQLDSLIGRSLETLPTEPFKNEAPFDRLAGMYWVIGRKDSESGPNEERWSKCPPLYTASIDAALTLVPRHHLWEARQGIEAKATVWRLEHDYDEGGRDVPVGYSTTFPAIAICIAALKARAAR